MTGRTVPAGGFFDLQGAVGISKHMGGLDATRELLAMCRVEDAREVLDVGCGIGVGPAYIAKTFGIHVVGVDLSEQMVDWARRRARQERVQSLVQVRRADVLALPFPDGRFDAVLCESVLDFVDDKAGAIRECVRVTKPGGRVGLNEGVWLTAPPPGMVERVKDALGSAVPTERWWRSLWENSGLQDREVRIRQVDPRTEIASRVRWIGWRQMVRAWGRALRFYVSNPSVRRTIKRQFGVPRDVFKFAGYGLFVGTKPTTGAPSRPPPEPSSPQPTQSPPCPSSASRTERRPGSKPA